jgi:hypothetical protein
MKWWQWALTVACIIVLLPVKYGLLALTRWGPRRSRALALSVYRRAIDPNYRVVIDTSAG